ncbi:hypothetical protein HHI36_012438 [Cryptolaemus montrouzieri]|uniref:SCP domain-containing protein n=1 Tax=Cryptolaemus montrouzieri TaxID=559131 RepID=A0ABD2NE83_9CUCU
MDDTIREEILLHHNKIRHEQTKNEPEPSSLALLEYNAELEEISACWAARCDKDYSECFRTSVFPEVSQTVDQVILDDPEYVNIDLWLQVMNSWLKVLEDVSFEKLHKVSDSNEDLFEHNIAQILSDKILFVGCSWSISNIWITFICSYGPKGPAQGEEIYKIGAFCSQCPRGYTCYNVKPFKRLCKPMEFEEMTEITEKPNTQIKKNVRTHKNQNKTRRKLPRRRNRADSRSESKPKKKGNLPLIVGICSFIAVFGFFTMVGVYVLIVSKISRGID